jgi:FkbM family methyltransferase
MIAAADRRIDQLEALLGEGLQAARERESTAFDRAAYPYERRIVIYGAGELGRKTLAGLRANGLEPLAFADRNPNVWHTRICGVPVYSPEDAINRLGADSVFAVAVWNPAATGGLNSIIKGLHARGCVRVVSFVQLFWKYPETFLPYYLWDRPSRIFEDAAAVREALALFSGRSQAEFLRHLKLRLTGEFGRFGSPDGGAQYFPQGLFRPREDECFVDCGAFDGDTLRSFADWTGGRFTKAVAIEADPANFAALRQNVTADPRLADRVRTLRVAIGALRSKVRFAASGLSGAAITDAGGLEVECLPLDEILLDEQPTFIKMDIEGAELDALQGASRTLRHRPLLAICAYHAQNHLWKVPLSLARSLAESRLVLRPHRMDGFDLVCYSIPLDRAGIAVDEEDV